MKYDRLNKIKQLLINQKQVGCTDLCNMFDVSIETIRRDLSVLEKEGVIKRVYGGAMLNDNTAAPNPMKPWDIRSNLNNVEKINIAREMIKHIQDNTTIALDSGTTILEIARLLQGRKNLNIITNDIYIASELSQNTNHTIYLIGGLLKKDDKITVGFLSTAFMNNFSHIDTAILTCDGFLDGIGDFNMDMCALKKAMIEKADKIYVSVDHSKFTIPPLYKVCGMKDLDLVITGSKAPAASIAALKHAGVEVIQVPCN